MDNWQRSRRDYRNINIDSYSNSLAQNGKDPLTMSHTVQIYKKTCLVLPSPDHLGLKYYSLTD